MNASGRSTRVCTMPSNRLGSRRSSAASASSRSRETSARRCSNRARPTCSVYATSASSTSGWSRRYAARSLVAASNPDSLLADNTRSWVERLRLGVGSAGASSRTTCDVGAAHAERVDARAARMAVAAATGCSAVLTKNGLFVEVDLRIGRLKCRLGGISPCCSASDGLDQAGHAGGAVEVADVGLDRADARSSRRLVGLAPKRARQARPPRSGRRARWRCRAPRRSRSCSAVDVGVLERGRRSPRPGRRRSARCSRP